MRTRQFNQQDQFAFARISGDWNPMHVDDIAARRLMFGRPVVHGIHMVLWALDCWCEGRIGPLELGAIRADFQRPLGVGETVDFVVKREQGSEVVVNLLSGKTLMTKISFAWRLTESCHSEHPIKSKVPDRRECRDWSADDIQDAAGRLELCYDDDGARLLFAEVCRVFPPAQVAALLASTLLVGVECPGRHSVYSQLVLNHDEDPAEDGGPCGMAYSVSAFDSRFNLLVMQVEAAGMTGTVRAFLRPPPREQSAYEEIRLAVREDEFKGQRALVVGGSRGLGEVTAKLLAAGGAEVAISYFRGAEDAGRVRDEIRAGGGIAESIGFDVLNPDAGWESGLGQLAEVTHLYYFATPHITPGERGVFSARRFENFCRYYVVSFAGLFDRLVPLGLKGVFYPSSVFVGEPPDNMGEYVISKVTGEALCDFYSRSHPGIMIHRPRLPRLATDQTASLMPLQSMDPVPVLLDGLRQLAGRSEVPVVKAPG